MTRFRVSLLVLSVLLGLAWERHLQASERLRDRERLRSLLYLLPDLLMSPERQSNLAGVEGEVANLWGQLHQGKSSPDMARLRQQGERVGALIASGQANQAARLLEAAVLPSIRALDEQMPAYLPERIRLMGETRWLGGASLLLLGLLFLKVEPVRRPEGQTFSPPLLRVMKSLLLVINTKGLICAVNQAACDALGYSENELLNMSFQDVYCERSDLLTMASRRDLEGVYRTSSGTLIPVVIACSVTCQDGKIHSLITLAQDVSQEQLTAAHLESSESRLRALLDRFVGAQEEERRSVARDVHDGMLQYIVAARLQLESLAHDLPEPVPGTLERARTHLQSAVDEGRRLIQDLRPSGLTELGLAGTLRMLLEDLGQELGWVTELRENLGTQVLSPALETTLYRIIQEALNNTRKHAQARSVSVNLNLQDNRIQLHYQDLGSGFDPALQPTGVGLQSMKERAELVGGWLQVTSAVGGGTSIHASLPFLTGSERCGL